MDARDVRMVQREKRLRLAFDRQAPEMRHEIGIVVQICMEKLDDDSALKMQVKGPPGLSHAARYQALLQLVISEESKVRAHAGLLLFS